ncbi:MAG: phage portal protein [Synergistaceae bacterium]|nr:phage portal protein [Synergistaceae bacterium]
MGIRDLIEKIWRKSDERVNTEICAGLPTAVLDSISGNELSESGEVVNIRTAMAVSAVYACVGIIAETIGQLPVRVKKGKRGGGTEPADYHPIYRLLGIRPNEWQTSQEFREMMTQHLCLTGNCYAEIIRDNKGTPRELLPLQPQHVTVEQRRNWDVNYRVQAQNGTARNLTQKDIFHLKYRTLDGYRGISPIGWQRETVGNAIAALNYSSRMLKNGGRPSGVLEIPNLLGEEAYKRLKSSWEENYSGKNAGKTAILEEGAKYSAVSMSNEDMQFIQSRQFTVEEVARIFRVPLHMIQSTEKTTSWGSGIEQMSIGFVQLSLLPWIKRWENCISKYLISESNIYVKLAVEGLMRGDMKTRYESYQKGILSGFISPNEARALEDMNPRDGGDEFFMPLNMQGNQSMEGEGKGEE